MKKEDVCAILVVLIIGSLIWAWNSFNNKNPYDLEIKSFDDYDEQILTEDYIAWKYNNCFEVIDEECKKEWSK